MTVKNKWNGNYFEVWEISEKTVKLKREDGTIFEISKSEFNFNYRVENEKYSDYRHKMRNKRHT